MYFVSKARVAGERESAELAGVAASGGGLAAAGTLVSAAGWQAVAATASSR